jgi:hypothetical protein
MEEEKHLFAPVNVQTPSLAQNLQRRRSDARMPMTHDRRHFHSRFDLPLIALHTDAVLISKLSHLLSTKVI